MSNDDRRAIPGAKARLINPHKIVGTERALYLNLYPYPEGVRRPMTRGDCVDGGFNAARPCPFVSCRHHLAADVMQSGSVLEPFGDTDVDDLPETCSLDVAEQSYPTGMTLMDVGYLMNLTRERARQLEEVAIRKLRRGLQLLGVDITHGMEHQDD